MWVKICGITRLECAEAVMAQQPDAIGLNFFSGSRRCIDVETARQIVDRLEQSESPCESPDRIHDVKAGSRRDEAPVSITPVGLFVNHSLQEIRNIASTCRIRTLQLHGDETPEFVAELEEYEIIKAFRVGQEGLRDVMQELEALQKLNVSLRGCLIDASIPGEYGGTGHRAPWDLLATEWQPEWPPLILAGGLTPANVAQAVEAVQPWGVDVASGVESSPGQQHPDAVRQFITKARQHLCKGKGETGERKAERGKYQTRPLSPSDQTWDD